MNSFVLLAAALISMSTSLCYQSIEGTNSFFMARGFFFCSLIFLVFGLASLKEKS